MVPDTNMITIITHTVVYFRWYLTPNVITIITHTAVSFRWYLTPT